MEKHQIWQVLKDRRGKDSAITSREIAMRTHLSERRVRRIIQALRLEGKPIASMVHYPYGYFIPKTREEAEECLRHIYSRPRKIFQMARELEKAFEVEIPRDQVLQLVLPGEGFQDAMDRRNHRAS